MNMRVLIEAQTLTSGAIQNGVPTDVFLRNRALVSWAETPFISFKTKEKQQNNPYIRISVLVCLSVWIRWK